ncbi:RNA polymerase sigma-70 factor [Flavihumibacter solisilvae]|jgi:RNA polymerase sigma-70 factor (ECF subfamily)|uniref:RNA polymerase subunit sigma-24 n=1 Tax=Flavihumibacter solisilvae TaxID=1349421 RepID=A0A0C1IGZ0_9BACT|nr:RNA polymerase sigma-70 factor [Flavihumibacter solisilvae]KIC93455.1 RNA polymerase subunit sigma-24 [Flavihumibacter solisilvae]
MAIPSAGNLILSTDHGPLEFEAVFKTHFKNLHAYAFTMVKDESTAEEMVQNVFCKLWEKREKLDIRNSATAYLYRAVYNECLNHLKHRKVKAAYVAYASTRPASDNNPASGKIQLNELESRLNAAINELPEQCRTIFQMSRFQELRYQEIADSLGLSIKTVENQMGKALRVLREKLVEYLPLLLLTLLNL